MVQTKARAARIAAKAADGGGTAPPPMQAHAAHAAGAAAGVDAGHPHEGVAAVKNTEGKRPREEDGQGAAPAPSSLRAWMDDGPAEAEPVSAKASLKASMRAKTATAARLAQADAVSDMIAAEAAKEAEANRAAKRSWRAAEELAASRQAAAVASARRQAQAHTQSAVPQAVAAAALPQLSRQEIEQARAERKTAKRAARAAGEDFVEAGPRPAAPQAAAAAPPQGAQLSRQEVEQARVERKTAKRAARAVGEDFAGRAPAPAAPAAAVVGGGGRVSDWSQPAPHHGASGQGARGGAPWEQQQQQQAGGDYGGGDGGGGALTEEERFAAKAARRREQKGAKRQRLLASQIGRVPPPWAPGAPASLPKHTFEVGDPRDHAETPFEAYRDLEPLLFRLAGLQGRTKATLRVYDPYFCAGSVKRHLSQLGFTDVYNENVDFYAQQASSGVPEFDVLITNPPFSGDHMARALAFAAACGKPWALLVPDFVARKAYFAPTLQIQESGEGPAMSKPCGPIYYLGPRTNAYMFSTPNPAEEGSCGGGGGGVRVFTAAAFQCVWILGLGAQHANAMAVWWSSRYGRVSDCELADSADALPQLASDRGKKRRDEAAAKRAASAACVRARTTGGQQ